MGPENQWSQYYVIITTIKIEIHDANLKISHNSFLGANI